MMPFICVHVDVNRTVVMSDAAAGRSCVQVLNAVISEAAYGRVIAPAEPDGQPGWTLALDTLLHNEELAPEGLITYTDFIETVLLPKKPRTHVPGLSERRRAFLDTFTDPGHPGERFAPVLHGLLEQLRGAPTSPRSGADSFVFVVPAFFTLLEWLVDHCGECFSCVFRTFGEDFERLTREVNDECARRPKLAALRVDIERGVGRVLRTGTADSDLHFVHECSVLPSRDVDEVRARFRVTSGAASVAEAIRALTNAHRLCFIGDDFKAWEHSGRHLTGGKLFPVNQSATDRVDVFFDDNIVVRDLIEKEQFIVDARDARTMAPLDVLPLVGVHLLHASSFAIVHSDQYFVHELERVLAARAAT